MGTLRYKRAEEEAGGEKLSPGGHAAGPMPTVPAVAREELAAAWTGERQNVFGIRRRRSRSAENRRVERTAQGGEGREHEHAGTELEAPRRDVPVRHRVAEHVEQRAERDRPPAGPRHGADGRAARDMPGDDHGP